MEPLVERSGFGLTPGSSSTEVELKNTQSAILEKRHGCVRMAVMFILEDMRHLTNNSLTVEHLYGNEDINVF